MTAPKLPRIMQRDLEEAEEIDFTEEKEHWNIYKLKDGTTLKIKLILRGVKRLKKWNPDGSPIYLINATNIVRTVGTPKELKAKPKASSLQARYTH